MDINGVHVPDGVVKNVAALYTRMIVKAAEVMVQYGGASPEYLSALSLTIGVASAVQICYNFKDLKTAKEWLSEISQTITR